MPTKTPTETSRWYSQETRLFYNRKPKRRVGTVGRHPLHCTCGLFLGHDGRKLSTRSRTVVGISSVD